MMADPAPHSDAADIPAPERVDTPVPYSEPLERRYTVQGLALLAPCHPATVRRAIAEGRLAATKRDGTGQWLIKQSDAERWIGER